MEHVDNRLMIFLSMLAVNVPTLLVCLVAGIVVVGRWNEAPKAALYAALGFGLALVLCFAMPVAHTMLQQWVFESGQRSSRVWTFTALSVVSSVLHAVIYLCLLAAIFAGRQKTVTSDM